MGIDPNVVELTADVAEIMLQRTSEIRTARRASVVGEVSAPLRPSHNPKCYDTYGSFGDTRAACGVYLHIPGTTLRSHFFFW